MEATGQLEAMDAESKQKVVGLRLVTEGEAGSIGTGQKGW